MNLDEEINYSGHNIRALTLKHKSPQHLEFFKFRWKLQQSEGRGCYRVLFLFILIIIAARWVVIIPSIALVPSRSWIVCVIRVRVLRGFVTLRSISFQDTGLFVYGDEIMLQKFKAYWSEFGNIQFLSRYLYCEEFTHLSEIQNRWLSSLRFARALAPGEAFLFVRFHDRPGDQKVVYDAELFLRNAVVCGKLCNKLHKLKSFVDLLMMAIGTSLNVEFLPIWQCSFESTDIVVGSIAVECKILQEVSH